MTTNIAKFHNISMKKIIALTVSVSKIIALAVTVSKMLNHIIIHPL